MSENQENQEPEQEVRLFNHVDSREDMFVDAMDDEFNNDTASRDSQHSAANFETENETEEVSSSPVLAEKQPSTTLPGDESEPQQNLHEGEIGSFTREIADLRHQLKALTELQQQQSLNNNDGLIDILRKEEVGDSEEKSTWVNGDDNDVSLHDLISDCSKYLKSATEERMQTQSTIRELNAVLYMKDQEIEDLHSKVAELSLSHDVAVSYMNSVEKVWSQSAEESSEKDQEIEVVTDRILGYLATVVYQEELVDNSVSAKIASAEKSIYWLIERYNWMLYEVDQLKQCSSKVEADLNVHEAFETVFAAARDEIFELKTKGLELAEKVSHLEDENRKLVEQVEKEKVEVETANAELGKTKTELEQEKTRCTNTKEKLSMAVTKGKALVQQRDTLKQSLAEKTSELEKCLTELQVKSSALETAELCKQELVKCENLTASLQETLSQRDAVVEKFREILSLTSVPEELETTDVMGKLKWLVDERNELTVCKEELEKWENLTKSLQETLSQKNTILEGLETVMSQTSAPEDLQSGDIIEKLKWLVDEKNVLAGCKEELTNWENLVASLQEMISQRNAIVKNCEEILSLISIPEELQSRDIIDKLKWLVDETQVLKDISREFDKLKSALDDVPDSTSDLVSRVGWLKELHDQSKTELRRLHDEIASISDTSCMEIERLSASLSAEMQEKDYLKEELSDISDKYNEVVEKQRLVAFKNEQMVKMLLEYSGITIEDQKGALQTALDPAELFGECFGKIKGRVEASTSAAYVDAVAFERIQSLLYVKDMALNLSERLLEDDQEVSSQVDDLAKELRVASQELAAMKEERVSLQKDLERAEEKSALLREKLSMAVKKGKGLFQDRENLKQQLDEKNSEIEKARLELQQQESMVAECRGHISKLEADLVAVKDQRDQLEQFLSDIKWQLDERNSEVEKLQLDLQQQESIVAECRDQSNRLSGDLEKIPKLEADLAAMKDHQDQLEQLLSVSNRQLDEKNSEIEKLRIELLQQESVVTECRGQINLLSSNLEQVPKLEAELVAMKDQSDQLEQFLLESNNMLQRVIESIDGIVLPVDSVFEEPVEKVNWLAGFIGECQNTKTQAEQESARVKEEAGNLTGKLAEAQATMKSLEDTLSAAENNIALLTEEKKQIEADKANVEQELQEAIEATRSQTSKFSEAFASRKSLEEALSQAENNISDLISEKEEAQASRVATETELEKVREEVATKTSKLTEAYEMIKSLEDSLSQAETIVALLSEQNNGAQVSRINLENDLKKLKDEADSHVTKLADAFATVKSLEDALTKAQNEVSVLEGERRIAEQEVSVLNSKLSACMEELAGTSGSLQSRTVELMGHLNDFQMLMKDDSLLPIVKKCFEKKFESLKAMDLILKNIKDCFVDTDSRLKIDPVMEDDLHVKKYLIADLDDVVNVGMENGEVDAAVDEIASCFRKTVEGFQMRNKILVANFEGFSTSADELIAALLRKLQTTRDEVISMFEHMELLKQRAKNMGASQQELGKAIAILENNVAVLHSVCIDATRQLQSEVNNLLELRSVSKLENVNHGSFPEVREISGDHSSEHWQNPEDNKFVEIAERLSLASGKIRNLTKLLESINNVAATLKDNKAVFEKVIQERDLYQIRVAQLEADVEKKEQEEKGSLMSASQLKNLFDKISEVEIPFSEKEVEVPLVRSSAHVKKLFDIIDSVNGLQNQINSLSRDKEELQSILLAKNLDIKHLKEDIETHIRDNPESEKIKDELLELTFSLEKIIDELGGSEFTKNQKSSGAKALLAVLEKQATALLLDVENSKSQAQELGNKFLASQQVVNELSTKVKSLEDSLQARNVRPEIVQERSVFEDPSLPAESEISEVEDVGPSLGKNSISPVPSAAHIRTLRKGSTDHLTIDIDSDSTRLVSNEETDEEKGHIFKSLSTSGLIPKQGKLIADRIDGIWVSGGRVLMSRPRARIGLIAYCLLLHIWLLGTIL